MGFRARRFAPRLQPLDDRSLPSVSFDLQGTILTVTGDAGANAISISDAGTADGVIVSGDGSSFQATGPITAIVVNTLGGDDTVYYDLTGPLAVTRLVSVDLGRGADTFIANLNGQTVSGSGTNLGISAYGGGGGDTLVLNAVGATVAPEAMLSADFHGEGGKDAISFDYSFGFLDLGNVIFTKDQKH